MQRPAPSTSGFRSGHRPLVQYLQQLEQIGVHHVALNLRFSAAPVEQTLEDLAEYVLPAFK